MIPPHQGSGAGVAIKGDAWVSGWYLAATELSVLKKAYTPQKKSYFFFLLFKVFGKTSWLSKPPGSYFLYVGVPR